MKILYLIHVDWHWILQRPQILALYLEKDNYCCVVNKYKIFSRKITTLNPMPEHIINIPQMRGESRISLIKLINEFVYKYYLKKANNYDVIWICYPLLYKFIPFNYKGKIIYDCMDDHLSMCSLVEYDELNKTENELLNKADLVIYSSNHLASIKQHLNKSVIVRNGYNITKNMFAIKENEIKTIYHIGYIGTISSWLDFELIEKASIVYKDVIFHFIGPVDIKIKDLLSRISSKNIIYEGVVEHHHLQNKIRHYDALMMPFLINNTVLSVDPVKLYEYIAFGKPIISIWYPEISRFEDFAYFYNTHSQFFNILDLLKSNGFKTKYNRITRDAFLKENSWSERYKIIYSYLSKL